MKAFTQPLHDLSEYDQIVSDLAGQRTPIHIDGCIDSQKCHLISSIGEPYPFKLIVTYNEIKAKEIYEDYRFFDRNVYYYPAKDIIFYNADIHSNLIVSQRMAVIRRMMDGCPVTVVTTIDGLSDRLLPLEELQKNRCVFKVGDILPLEALSRKLTALGFERVSQVEGPGQFAVRGGILDIYNLADESPYRVELWGDEIDSIRSFDVESQRSIEQVDEVTIDPAAEYIMSVSVRDRGLKLIDRDMKQQVQRLKDAGNYEAAARLKQAVAELKDNAICREEIREYLNPVYDLERLVGKITYQSANPRDLIAFQSSLSMLPSVKCILKDMESDLLKEIYEELDPLEELCDLVGRAIQEEPPLAMKEGGIIKDGYNEEVDRLRKAKSEGKNWLADLETKEREKTGIKNLRIRYNKVFGYYLEVTNSFKDLVPDYYTRKQTLANAERYIIPELKELEDTILGAEDKLCALEYELYCEVRNTIAAELTRIQRTAKAVAKLDVIASLALVAERNNYVRPKINEKGVIDIRDGRHPVVEKMIPNDMFIANDTYLDDKKQRISIITGPNMAGKSTYMRQAALIVLMAQLGSFVPASSANIGLVDRIFTRVGASDDLASGQSTFMVEMNEVANILRNATSKSLLILDEIGRGTSTFDGLSIAWAVVEYISNSKLLGAKTLFATHYHELTELEGKISNVNNYCIAVKEKGDDIVFLRKIVKGGADKSYGIQVAKLAGVPDPVINRAKEIVEELVTADITGKVKDIAVQGSETKKKTQKKLDEVDLTQFSLFDTVKDDDVLNELKELDISHMTPMDAMNKLYQLQNKLRNRW